MIVFRCDYPGCDLECTSTKYCSVRTHVQANENFPVPIALHTDMAKDWALKLTAKDKGASIYCPKHAVLIGRNLAVEPS